MFDFYEERQKWIDQMLEKSIEDGCIGDADIALLFDEIEENAYPPNHWEVL